MLPAWRRLDMLAPRGAAVITLAAVALALAGCGNAATQTPKGPVATCRDAPQGSCLGSAYSCTGDATPASFGATCSASANGDGTTSYCCVTPMCTLDASQQACGGASHTSSNQQSYICPAGGFKPSVPSSTLCTAQAANPDGSVPYCCTDFNAVGCEPTTGGSCLFGSRAFSCTGANRPTAADPSLLCGSPETNADGTTIYCCAPNSCTNLGGTINSCGANSTAYDCPGYAKPDAPGSTCTSLGQYSTDDPKDRFCCTLGPCVELGYSNQPGDPNTQCAQSQGTPYGCTGASTPAASDATIWCQTLGPGADGQTNYCCRKSSCGYVQTSNYCDPSYTAAVSCTGNAMPSSLGSTLNSCVVAPTQPGDVPGATVYCCKT
jgi:hypothetical protein